MQPALSIEAIDKGKDINIELIKNFDSAICLFYRFCRAMPWIFIILCFVMIPIMAAYGAIHFFN